MKMNIFVHQPNWADKFKNLPAQLIFYQPCYCAGKNVLIVNKAMRTIISFYFHQKQNEELYHGSAALHHRKTGHPYNMVTVITIKHCPSLQQSAANLSKFKSYLSSSQPLSAHCRAKASTSWYHLLLSCAVLIHVTPANFII